MPIAWIISRLCEEFKCTPDDAADLPFATSMQILSLRDYARARQMLESLSPEEVRKRNDPSLNRVLELQAELDIADMRGMSNA